MFSSLFAQQDQLQSPLEDTSEPEPEGLERGNSYIGALSSPGGTGILLEVESVIQRPESSVRGNQYGKQGSG